jgi:O-antigen ligase
VALCIAVLAFGGTAAPFFLFTQLIIIGIAVLLLVVNLCSPLTDIRFPTTPLALIALVLLQIVPFPAPLARVFSASGDGSPGATRFTLSVAQYQTVSHLLLLVTYLAAFYVVLLLSRDRRARRRLVYTLLALGMFEACYGLVQYLTGWQQIFSYVKKYYLEDATGTYINHNHFAGFLEMVLPFAVALALRQARILRRVDLDGRGHGQLRALFSAKELPLLFLWIFVAATIFTALIFSRSRMGFISAIASLIVILALFGSTSFSARTRAVVAVLFLVAVAGLVIWIGSDPVISHFETLGQEYSQTSQTRIAIWRDILKLIRQHPLFGTGLGTFSIAYTSVQTAFLNLFVDHAHCDYLEVASELGLPGGILVFALIFWVLAQAVRHYWRAEDRFDTAVYLGSVGSISAILVHSLADFNLYIPANALIFCIVLALARSTPLVATRSGRHGYSPTSLKWQNDQLPPK